MSRRIPPPPKDKLSRTEQFIVLPGSTFAAILTDIPEEDRPGECLAVFTTLLGYSELNNGTIPTVPQLQSLLNIGRNRVWKRRRTLTEHGFIIVTPYRDKKTGKVAGQRTVINLNRAPQEPSPLFSGAMLLLRNTNTLPGPVEPGVLVKEKKKTDHRPNDFETFYQSYPRKLNKKEAEKAWLQKIKDKTLPPIHILTAAIGHDILSEWADMDLRYIPHPSTWLRGEQWNNNLSTTPTDDTEELLEFVVSMAEVDKREARKYLKWLKTQGKKLEFGDREILPPTGGFWKQWSKTYNK